MTMHPQGVLGPGYTVHDICGCLVTFGSMPIDHFAALAKTMPKNALLSTRLCALMGASAVMGTQESLAELEKLDLPISAVRHAWSSWAARHGHPSSLVQWLLRGDQGLSSLVMARVLIDASLGEKGHHHPRDSFDLERCVEFFKASGLPREALDAMSGVSVEWAALVGHWDDLCTALARVMPGALAVALTKEAEHHQRRAIVARMEDIYRQARQECQSHLRPGGVGSA